MEIFQRDHHCLWESSDYGERRFLQGKVAVFRAGTVVAASLIAGAAVAVSFEVRPGDAAAVTIAAASLAVLACGPVRRGLGCLALAMAMCAWGAAARDRAVARVASIAQSALTASWPLTPRRRPRA